MATINWKQRTWNVSERVGGPNGNTFKANNVSIDANGNLVLKITKQGGIWTAAEVFLPQSLGYGTYRYVLASPIKYEKNTVAAGFTYADDSNELDIEFSYWGGTTTNVGFTVQPSPYTSANNQKFTVPEGIAGYVCSIVFLPNRNITFTITDANGNTLKSWKYTGSFTPKQNQPWFFNLWLQGNKQLNSEQVMAISDFSFTPQGTTPTPPVTSQTTTTQPPTSGIVALAKAAGFTDSQTAFLTGTDYKKFVNS